MHDMTTMNLALVTGLFIVFSAALALAQVIPQSPAAMPAQPATSKPGLGGRWAGGIAALLIIIAAGPCRADAPDGARDARLLVQHLGAQAIDALGPSTPPAQRISVFRELLRKDFDLTDAARFALGSYMHGLSPAQQQEFLTLYRDALAAAYAERLGQYAGEPFRVTGAHRRGDETIVSSEVARSGGPPVKIDWQVSRRAGRLAITDVLVDGVSQKLAQREAFSGIIERNGGQPAAVIAALRQRLQEEPAAKP
jgi:phospholipid transport system substrate-binding protein